ncbi:MAG: hypothetical protein IPG32_00395 [Saprospirales bacterium]|nr:hypothetical protein [Saprospirales bacterium]
MTQQFRYPGVRPFSRSQANVFFGRDKDCDELVQMIDLDKITVLYSKSGLGKSSLLNAAVIPAVEAAGQLMAFSFRFGAFYRDKEGSPSTSWSIPWPKKPVAHPLFSTRSPRPT